MPARAPAKKAEEKSARASRQQQQQQLKTEQMWEKFFFGNAKFSAALAGFYSLVIGLELDPSSTRGLIDKSGTLV